MSKELTETQAREAFARLESELTCEQLRVMNQYVASRVSASNACLKERIERRLCKLANFEREIVLLIVRGGGKLRKPRWRTAGRTQLAPGQRWTVELGTVDGRVIPADYGYYLRSSEWRAKRQWWWENSGRPEACAACNARWSLDGGDLHHRSYDRLGYEQLEDLINLCKVCHGAVHKKVNNNWDHLTEITDLVVDQIRAYKSRGIGA